MQTLYYRIKFTSRERFDAMETFFGILIEYGIHDDALSVGGPLTTEAVLINKRVEMDTSVATSRAHDFSTPFLFDNIKSTLLKGIMAKLKANVQFNRAVLLDPFNTAKVIYVRNVEPLNLKPGLVTRVS